MIAGKTGAALLRAGLPQDWRVGDKTGRSGEGAVNDVAIAWPPRRAPILIASYLYAPGLSADRANAVHTDVARAVAAAVQLRVDPPAGPAHMAGGNWGGGAPTHPG